MNNCIVCDIQPMYEKFIDFNLRKFTRFLNNKDYILFFYVGKEVSGIGDDTKEDIIFWLLKNGLKEDKICDITFIDKGYAFFRCLMDNKYPEDKMIELIAYMQETNINNSEDINDKSKIKYFQLDEYVDNIYLPDFEYSDVREFNNSTLIGGGLNECLKELTLYFDAVKLKYKLNHAYVYGN